MTAQDPRQRPSLRNVRQCIEQGTDMPHANRTAQVKQVSSKSKELSFSPIGLGLPCPKTSGILAPIAGNIAQNLYGNRHARAKRAPNTAFVRQDKVTALRKPHPDIPKATHITKRGRCALYNPLNKVDFMQPPPDNPDNIFAKPITNHNSQDQRSQGVNNLSRLRPSNIKKPFNKSFLHQKTSEQRIGKASIGIRSQGRRQQHPNPHLQVLGQGAKYVSWGLYCIAAGALGLTWDMLALCARSAKPAGDTNCRHRPDLKVGTSDRWEGVVKKGKKRFVSSSIRSRSVSSNCSVPYL